MLLHVNVHVKECVTDVRSHVTLLRSSMSPTVVAHNAQNLSASTVLWAHLRKDMVSAPNSSAESSLTMHTPITPIDKNGTSMRILLHDTSHNLEKFSDRVDKLTSGIDET